MSACSDGSGDSPAGAGATAGSGNAGAAGASAGSGGTSGGGGSAGAAGTAGSGGSAGTGGSPYACGWIPRDPGNLVATGPNEGDVIENIPLIDQCGEELPLWDLAGEYHMLFMTTVW